MRERRGRARHEWSARGIESSEEEACDHDEWGSCYCSKWCQILCLALFLNHPTKQRIGRNQSNPKILTKHEMDWSPLQNKRWNQPNPLGPSSKHTVGFLGSPHYVVTTHILTYLTRYPIRVFFLGKIGCVILKDNNFCKTLSKDLNLIILKHF